MKTKCDSCKAKLKPGDRVIRTFTIEKDHFENPDGCFSSGKDDIELFMCENCCNKMNFRG